MDKVVVCCFFPKQFTVGVLSKKKELATLTGRAPELCGWALRLGSVAGLCVQALSSSCPLWLGSVLCPGLVPVAGLCFVSRPCPPLVLVLAAPLHSVAGFCGSALCPGLVLLLSLSWPRP